MLRGSIGLTELFCPTSKKIHSHDKITKGVKNFILLLTELMFRSSTRSSGKFINAESGKFVKAGQLGKFVKVAQFCIQGSII